MMYSESYEAFSENQAFDNGQTMQAPPANTIPRGFMPEARDNEGRLIVGSNPYNSSMTDYHMKRGKILFERTCSTCHGDKGLGDGLVVTNGGFPKPPSFSERRWRKMDGDNYLYPTGHVYNVITDGIGNMPSHAQQLYQEDRWYVSEYVREYLMRGGAQYNKSL